MPPDPPISELAHLIQISVAPVFLLTGVAGILSVLTARLGRIVDRARVLEAPRADFAGVDALALQELRVLRSRIDLIHRAITLCTYSALLVAGVIAALFLGAFVQQDLSSVVAVTFVGAMLLLIGGLVSFLAEVHMATRQLRQIAKWL